MHDDVVQEVLWTITHTTQQHWISAIIDSEITSSTALHMAAENYEAANCHGFVSQLREAADKSKRKLSIQRAKHLLSVCCKGPAAIQFAVAEQSTSRAEIEAMLQISCEAAGGLTARTLGSKDKDAPVYGEFMDESSDERCY